VAALFQLSDGLQAVAAGALRGAGDTRFALLANLIGHYGCGLPLGALLAFGWGWGAVGLWWGLSVGLTAVALALVARFAWLTRSSVART
jgi:MATE family multidrug resistance protein